MNRQVIFQGGYCRVVRVEDQGKTSFLIEEQKGLDGMGNPKWDHVSLAKIQEITAELGKALDDAQNAAQASFAQLQQQRAAATVARPVDANRSAKK